MSENMFILDEKKYPISWRFNSKDCGLTFDEKRKIVLLDEKESEILWDISFPFNHLMRMGRAFCSVIEKNALEFDCPEQSSSFFKNKLKDVSLIFFFWGRKSSAIVPVEIFVKSWSDFFYPGDETSIILIANTKKMIYSYEDEFFYADIIQ
ncbi:hypothetical protein [Mixta intestinalis]|uniref:Uncharacterized protein n=1 Tax=Mixta intestinalis TaxID=1615494 RepID=A0A6P1Q651_9GAMM|nr:hypothetical protein [Mixta intestinalis]QHM73921.1 hypothetical protein C7M51_04282 [Mixta intestinalis]